MTADARELADLADAIASAALNLAEPVAVSSGLQLVPLTTAGLISAVSRAYLAAYSHLPASEVLGAVSLLFAEASKQVAEAARQGATLQ